MILSIGGSKMGLTSAIQSWKSRKEAQKKLAEKALFLSDYEELAERSEQGIVECSINWHSINFPLTNCQVVLFDENKAVIGGTFLFQPLFLSNYDSPALVPAPDFATDLIDYRNTLRSLLCVDCEVHRHTHYVLVEHLYRADFDLYFSGHVDADGRIHTESIPSVIERITTSARHHHLVHSD